ncbi:MAG: VCBS repeat-containing protein [Chthoniobacterales bacterium]|nr:VCBS repeat-containing protein [Chthoniobacterales bacterium]
MQSLRTLLAAFAAAGTTIFSHDAVAQSFSPPVDYPSGGLEPGGGSVADFNEDGHLDVLNGSFKTDKVSVLLGTGDGGFGAPNKITVGFGTVSTAVADLRWVPFAMASRCARLRGNEKRPDVYD